MASLLEALLATSVSLLIGNKAAATVEKVSAETGPNVDQKVPPKCLVKFAHA
jgi:hypothetical protein